MADIRKKVGSKDASFPTSPELCFYITLIVRDMALLLTGLTRSSNTCLKPW